MKIYTMEDWERDGVLRIVPGQEVCERLYYEQMNCVPPKCPDGGEMLRRAEQLGVRDRRCTMTGFLAGEPVTTCRTWYLYDAYCHQGSRYHYLGLMKEAKA